MNAKRMWDGNQLGSQGNEREKMKKSRFGTVLGSSVLSALMYASQSDGAVLYTTGFEPTGSAMYPADNFTANQTLNGQGGWTGSVGGSPAPVAGVYNYAQAFGSNSNPSNAQFTGLVDSNIGSQSIGYYSVPINYTPNAVTGSIVDVVFELGVPQAGAGSPFFGVIAQANGVNIAGIGVNGNNGALVPLGGTLTGNTTFSGSANPGMTGFFNYELQLNYTTQTFNVYATPLGATAFTSANLINSGPFLASAATFSDAALTSFALTSAPATGNGYYDYYSVTSVVPEPASVGLLLSAVAAGFTRRRRTAGELTR
jgi:hypothetical protein